MKNKSWILKIGIILCVPLLGYGIVYASGITRPDGKIAGYRILPNVYEKVSPQTLTSVCNGVKNTGSAEVFVPMNTQAEWDAFKNNAANKEISDCLYNNVHTGHDCGAIGGTVDTTPDGKKICKWPGKATTPPSGWTWNSYYKITSSKTCLSFTCVGLPDSCTASGSGGAWTINAPATCDYINVLCLTSTCTADWDYSAIY